MPHYEWTGDGPYHDNHNDRVVQTGETVELSEHIGEPSPELVRVDGPSEDSDPEPQPEDHPDADPEALATRNAEYASEGQCGFYDPDAMADPCARLAGWGTDNDDGPCRDHI